MTVIPLLLGNALWSFRSCAHEPAMWRRAPTLQVRWSATAGGERGANVRGGKMSRLRTAEGEVNGSAWEWRGIVQVVAR